ncbi:uncharacterized protein LOC121402927 isoform X1 [Xenopus laevis]|uniref:Uncharacterized protein LOC121396568 isoform X1 n=1 Tax=Xenopus laevis TaxID=8355 RepID=A0A8J1MWI1_XENLA|nr:uncharacterized protein LOC121396568 isoform X1 [Xenopus laevis]XP_041445809.1 uncharacterized protein LOC121402927 isoform X1 [Xenopus laevis]XP_041445810.1 uncharacterized protein LOC121402927 isoform X1 [Xenopus laevis]XP_041445811.1 uncharacterized protein LOC121402927 isoform X1 [Xenopus laevis]
MGCKNPKQWLCPGSSKISDVLLCVFRKASIPTSCFYPKDDPWGPTRQKDHHRSPQKRTLQRYIFSPILKKKKEWGFQSNSELRPSEQIPQNKKIQNGDTEVYMPVHKPWRLDAQDRYTRCLSACSSVGTTQTIPTVPDPGKALSIPSAPIRTSFSPKSFHQGACSHDGFLKAKGDPDFRISRRYIGESSFQKTPPTTPEYSSRYSEKMGVARQLGKVHVGANTTDSISGSYHRLQKTSSKSNRGKDFRHTTPSRLSVSSSILDCQEMSTNSGETYVHHRGGEMGTNSSKTSPDRILEPMEQESPGKLPVDSPITDDDHSSLMVAQERELASSCIYRLPYLGNTDHGCKQSGVGSTLQTLPNSREVDTHRKQKILQLEGTEGGATSDPTLPKTPQKKIYTDQIRQPNHSELYKQPGRNQIQTTVVLDHNYFRMGSKQCEPPQSLLHTRDIEHLSGSPQQEISGYRGVGVEPADLRPNMPKVGSHIHRPDGYLSEQEESSVLFVGQGPQSDLLGCFLIPMELSTGLHLPSNLDVSKNHQKNSGGQSSSHPHSSLVAEKTLVPPLTSDVSGGALQTPCNSEPFTPGIPTAPRPRVLGPDCLEIERIKLRKEGLSEGAINTLISSRKMSTSSKYNKIWEKFSSWGLEKFGSSFLISEVTIIEFLQSGLEASLSASTLKGQISAISAYTDIQWSSYPLIKKFFKGLIRIHPPVKDTVPPWDLSLVLDALTKAPFEPLDDLPLKILTLKTVFLLAISSAKRVGELHALSSDATKIQFLHDKVTLRTRENFIPKVATKFHMSQDIVLPTFFENPKNEEENRLHNLDVVRCLKRYIHKVSSFRKSENLLILFGGPRQGMGASKKVISAWIKECILMAYSSQTVPGPSSVKAHSTRGIAASWAFHAQVPADEICKAATWKNLHTFSKHYCFDVYSKNLAGFGLSVLSAAAIKVPE